MKYPKTSYSKIQDWNLNELDIKSTEYTLPSEIIELKNLENTILLVNGTVVENTSSAVLTNGEYFQEETNSLLNDNNVIVFDLLEAQTINVINYVSNTDADFKLAFNVKCDGEVKFNEYITSSNANKIKYNLVLNTHKALVNSEVVYTSVAALEGAKAYLRYDLYSHRSDSNITFNYGGFNDSDVVVDVYGEPREHDNVINTNAFVITNNNEHVNLVVDLVNVHTATHTSMKNYVVACGDSRIVVDGINKIMKGMALSTAYQTSRALILGENAEAHANPLLLIDEYDVKAGHGATVGKIDDEHLYYLMSRGLSKLEASSLIVNGYVNYLYDYIYNDTLKSIVEKVVVKKLK